MGNAHHIGRALLAVEGEAGKRLLKKKRKRPKKTPRWGEYEPRECRVRSILATLSGMEWPSTRSIPWLKNDNGRALELDCYCAQWTWNDKHPLGTAFECDGLQHRRHIAFYHKTKEDWEAQQARDLLKDSLCRANGLKLVRVPPRERLCDSKLVLWITERLF